MEYKNPFFLSRNIYEIYTQFGFTKTNKIQLELTDDTTYYENTSGWILSHMFLRIGTGELKKHDSIKYYYRLEIFKKDMSSYNEIREYIWLSYNIEEEILKIENKVLSLFQENLKSDFRDYQLKRILQ